eukprot:767669-Hanusia_phi.AAC.12
MNSAVSNSLCRLLLVASCLCLSVLPSHERSVRMFGAKFPPYDVQVCHILKAIETPVPLLSDRLVVTRLRKCATLPAKVSRRMEEEGQEFHSTHPCFCTSLRQLLSEHVHSRNSTRSSCWRRPPRPARQVSHACVPLCRGN